LNEKSNWPEEENPFKKPFYDVGDSTSTKIALPAGNINKYCGQSLGMRCA